MSTVITAKRDGDIVRRCDATCHDAKGCDCQCVCGGRFHGVGTESAQREVSENWRELAGELRAEGEGALVRASKAGYQLLMW